MGAAIRKWLGFDSGDKGRSSERVCRLEAGNEEAEAMNRDYWKSIIDRLAS